MLILRHDIHIRLQRSKERKLTDFPCASTSFWKKSCIVRVCLKKMANDKFLFIVWLYSTILSNNLATVSICLCICVKNFRGMADALIERRPPARFFCHRCNVEFEDVLQVRTYNFITIVCGLLAWYDLTSVVCQEPLSKVIQHRFPIDSFGKFRR